MKKKILSLIAVTAALATAGCALVACGGNGDGKVKTEVTKEQWTAALSVEQNFTSNFKVDVEFDRKREDGTMRTENATFIVGPEKFGSYSVSFSEPDDKGKKKYEEEMIAIIGKDKDIGYSRKSRNDENGKWVVGEWLVDEDKHREMDLESWTHMLGNMGMNSNVFSFADKYDSFKYESGQYVLDGAAIVLEDYSEDGYSRKETADEVTFKFANSKLTYAEVKVSRKVTYTDGDEVEVDESTINYTYSFTYGGQKIAAPKIEAK